jgi:F0F1-type ATP synthase beta subunit
MQRRDAGVVRGVAASPLDALPRGSTLLSSGRQALGSVAPAQFAEIFRSLVGPTPNLPARRLETGIKVIDVMCPLVAGGTLAIAGEAGGGATVVMEEIVRRVSDGRDPLTMFILLQPPSSAWPPALEPGYSFAEELKKEGYSEGTRGSVQGFFLRTEDGPWTAERLAMLAPADTVIRLSRAHAKAKVYPTVDVLASRSRLLEAAAVDPEHAVIAERVRDALAALWANGGRPAPGSQALMLERALKLQNYFAQPFLCAAPYHGLPKATVGAAEAVRTCGEILDGRHDDVPVRAFYFTGGIDEIRASPDRALGFGPVTLPPPA